MYIAPVNASWMCKFCIRIRSIKFSPSNYVTKLNAMHETQCDVILLATLIQLSNQDINDFIVIPKCIEIIAKKTNERSMFEISPVKEGKSDTSNAQ